VTHEAFCQVLGYQETPSFVRAFRHWTGMPPASYRKSLTD
jgi:AraC-like DNA-binding protein